MHSSAFTVAAAVDKTICDHTCDRQNTWRLLVQKDLGLKGKKKQSCSNVSVRPLYDLYSWSVRSPFAPRLTIRLQLVIYSYSYFLA